MIWIKVIKNITLSKVYTMSSTKILQFKVKKKFIIQFALLVVLFSWAVWFDLSLFGIVGVGLLACAFFISSNGIEIDCENKRYRKGRIVGNICTGSWKALPDVKYISVFSVNMVTKVRGRSNACVTSKNRVIEVNLIYGKRGRLTVYKTSEANDAFEKACLISEKMNLKILDATSADRKLYENATEYRSL
jgi:hypothetical protein